MSWMRSWLACLAGFALVSPLHAQTFGTPIFTDIADDAECWKVNSGASFYALQPFHQNNVAYSVTSQTINAAGTVANGLTQTQQFDWSMQPAMDFWLGVTSPCGLGIRGRYFHLDANSSDATLDVPSALYNGPNSQVIAVTPSPFLFNSPPGAVPQQNPGAAGLFGGPSPFIVNFPGAPASVDHFTFHSDLRIDAADLEFTGVWKTDKFSLLGGVGGRYLRLSQDYNASLVNVNSTSSTLTESLQYSRLFQGGGPTVSAQMSWHPFMPNLSLFAGGRGSLLVGQTSQVTSGSRIVNDPAGTFGAGVSSISFLIPTTSNDTMPVAEVELGLEYALRMRRNTIFFRGAVVDQTYFGAGNASRPDGNLSLLGFQLSVGFNY
jgi:hypothetical protein